MGPMLRSTTPSERNSRLWTGSGWNTDTMAPAINQLLVSALFLCALEDAALSDGGVCTDKRCVAFFLQSKDFADARESCKSISDFSGRLFKYDSTTFADVSKHLPVGKFWLEQKEDAADPQACSSIAVSTESVAQARMPCEEKLTGFLCQYAFQDSCGEVKAAEVTYNAPMDFEVLGSRAFPQGTTALVGAPGAKRLRSKHVCFGGSWLQAPWTCEVMLGGCERGCNKTSNACTCPAGLRLSGNGVTCEEDACALCAHRCQQVGDAYACACREGYRLMGDGVSCEGASECGDGDPCAGAGQVCAKSEGRSVCKCRDGFRQEEGACVDARICFECEHMLCNKSSGAYECACKEGYKVRAAEPTKCDRYCSERECAAECDRNSKGEQCYCPTGYILDQSNSSNICRDMDECDMWTPCEHTCVNLPGSFECGCFPGFTLHNDSRCVPAEGVGPGPTASYPTPAAALVPSYVKAGSALGIAVFLLLCAALLALLVHSTVKRCRTLDLTTLKHSNMDIFHLQQVTTDTYKRLSF